MINFITLININKHGHFQQIQMYQNTLRFIWYVLLTYNKYISSNTLLVILFIYLSLLKKTEIRVKPGHLQQIHFFYWSVISCKASFIFNWKHFIIHYRLWIFVFLSVHKPS